MRYCTTSVTSPWPRTSLLYSIRVAEPPQKALVLNEAIAFLGTVEIGFPTSNQVGNQVPLR